MRRSAGLVCAVVLGAGCQPPSDDPSQPGRAAEQIELLDLVGQWRWILRTEEAGTSRVEDEQWVLKSDPTATSRLVGRYVRDVEARSLDSYPFQCNQRPWYRQRSVYDVTVETEGRSYLVRETGYAAEESPCDHGFRRVGTYKLEPRGERAILRWDGGEQTLWHVAADPGALPEPPAARAFAVPTGPWQWQTRFWDDDGNIRDEAEWWEITRRSDTELDATYRRRVTVHSRDGAPIPCAGAPSWSFDDAYVLDGVREEEHWHVHERGVQAGQHACLRETPQRSLDEATVEQIGDYLVLEWRGKRRQILYRPR